VSEVPRAQELARQVMAGKALGDALAALGAAARPALLADMAATGSERIRVRGEGGEDYGTVSLQNGRTVATITDEAALIAWVTERYPTEVVTTIRPKFLDLLLDAACKAGDPVDPATGEVIPGVRVDQGEPFVVARPSKAAKARAADLVANTPLVLPPSPNADPE
jgi:hypothetical protein